MLKEIVSSTYLITDENTLSKLAEEIDALYAKVKTMTPSDDGVPIGEVPSVGDSTKKHYASTSTVPAPTIGEVQTVSDSRKKQSPTTSTVPPSPQKHGAKKHPASGRYGVKAEWQRKFFPVKNCPSTSRKRKHSQANEPKEKLKKIKVKQKDLPSTDEEHYSFSQDATFTKPGSTHDDRQWELQKSHDVTAADQLPSNLESEVVLCDFHREKAWWEWTSKSTNGVLNKRDEVLSRMRRIAKAATLKDMDKAVKDFQDSAVWTENARLRSWFSTKWLPAKKRWCQAYRGVNYIVAVHTNNGIERQNETLKFQYLDGYKNCSL